MMDYFICEEYSIKIFVYLLRIMCMLFNIHDVYLLMLVIPDMSTVVLHIVNCWLCNVHGTRFCLLYYINVAFHYCNVHDIFSCVT